MSESFDLITDSAVQTTFVDWDKADQDGLRAALEIPVIQKAAEKILVDSRGLLIRIASLRPLTSREDLGNFYVLTGMLHGVQQGLSTLFELAEPDAADEDEN